MWRIFALTHAAVQRGRRLRRSRTAPQSHGTSRLGMFLCVVLSHAVHIGQIHDHDIEDVVNELKLRGSEDDCSHFRCRADRVIQHCFCIMNNMQSKRRRILQLSCRDNASLPADGTTPPRHRVPLPKALYSAATQRAEGVPRGPAVVVTGLVCKR